MAVILAFVLVVLAGPASAHDLWLEKEPGGFVLYYGHKHSGHEGPQLVDYPADWVKEALCFGDKGARIPFRAEPGPPYRVRGECAVVRVLASSGYWTKTPYGTKNVPRAEASMPIRSWLSYESVKRIERWNEALARPLTRGLELIPRKDPLRLRKGDKLRLLVTFGGQPVKGAVVAYDGKPRGQSGTDGKVNVRIRHPGFQVVQASLHRADESGKSDEVIYTANLNFELPER